MTTEVHSVLEAYKFIKDKIRHPSLDERMAYNCSSDYVVFPLHRDPPKGVAKAGVRYPSMLGKQIYFKLTQPLSEKIIGDYKGFGTRALTDKLTMTEKAVIQKPRPILGHLGLPNRISKKNIARIEHDAKGNIEIIVDDESGAIYVDGLLKSLLEKN